MADNPVKSLLQYAIGAIGKLLAKLQVDPNSIENLTRRNLSSFINQAKEQKLPIDQDIELASKRYGIGSGGGARTKFFMGELTQGLDKIYPNMHQGAAPRTTAEEQLLLEGRRDKYHPGMGTREYLDALRRTGMSRSDYSVRQGAEWKQEGSGGRYTKKQKLTVSDIPQLNISEDKIIKYADALAANGFTVVQRSRNGVVISARIEGGIGAKGKVITQDADTGRFAKFSRPELPQPEVRVSKSETDYYANLARYRGQIQFDAEISKLAPDKQAVIKRELATSGRLVFAPPLEVGGVDSNDSPAYLTRAGNVTILNQIGETRDQRAKAIRAKAHTTLKKAKERAHGQLVEIASSAAELARMLYRGDITGINQDERFRALNIPEKRQSMNSNRAANSVRYSVSGDRMSVYTSGEGSMFAKFIEHGTRPIDMHDFVKYAKKRRMPQAELTKTRTYTIRGNTNPKGAKGTVVKTTYTKKNPNAGNPYLIIPAHIDVEAMMGAGEDVSAYTDLPIQEYMGMDSFTNSGKARDQDFAVPTASQNDQPFGPMKNISGVESKALQDAAKGKPVPRPFSTFNPMDRSDPNSPFTNFAKKGPTSFSYEKFGLPDTLGRGEGEIDEAGGIDYEGDDELRERMSRLPGVKRFRHTASSKYAGQASSTGDSFLRFITLSTSKPLPIKQGLSPYPVMMFVQKFIDEELAKLTKEATKK